MGFSRWTIESRNFIEHALMMQVADLEEERRKLKMEMKFRAKYHGEEALKLGLSPEQLLLLEQFTEELKHGTNEEGKLVDQLSKRVRNLCAEIIARGYENPAHSSPTTD